MITQSKVLFFDQFFGLKIVLLTLKPKVHDIARLLFCFQILIDSGVTTVVERGDFEPTSTALELTCLRY